jgi:hypothetical protein
MINKALQFTGDILNQFLKKKLGLTENKVLLNNLVEPGGAIPAANQNKVVVSLINIEKETTKQFYNRNQRTQDSDFSDIQPSERYNLDILISGHFDDYSETLKFLTAVIGFFQVNTFMDAQAAPSIPDGLIKLEYEIEKINYHQMQSLWTAMGAKYQPSVIYKMRLVTIQSNEVRRFIPAVTGVATETHAA